MVKNKSIDNLLELVEAPETPTPVDKATQILEKNSTSRMLSKAALQKKRRRKMAPQENMKYEAIHSVIDENFSEANMLNSFDERLDKSIKKGENFMNKQTRRQKINMFGQHEEMDPTSDHHDS